MRHASASVELQGGVELPEFERGLVGEGEECLVAAGEGFLHEFAAVGGLHVVEAVGGGEVEAFEEGVGGIDLEGVGVGLAAQVGDVDEGGVGVVVDDGLLVEVGVVVLGIEFQGLAEEGDVEGGTDAVVPRLFLLQGVDEEGAAAGEQVGVFCQRMHGAVAFASGEAQAEEVGWRVFQVEAWRDEGAVAAAVVGSQSCHGNEFLVEVVGVLGIDARGGLVFVGVQIVVVEGESCGEVVSLGEVGLEEELCVDVSFVGVVGLVPVGGICLVEGCVCHEGEVGAVFGMEDEGVLHVGFVAVGLHTDGVQMVVVGRRVVCLSAVSVFLQQGEPAMEEVAVAFPFPAVLQVVLLHVGLVEKAVVVLVVVSPVVLIVEEKFGAEVGVEVDVAIGICLEAAECVAVEIEGHALLVVGLQILNVNLSRDALVAVAHRGGSFRHLYALHPRSRHIVEGIGGGCPTEVGQVLGEHLHVGAAQSQEFDLFGTRGGIGVVHVHRWVGGETLAQIAACRLEEFCLIDFDAIFGSTHAECARLVCRNGHVVQFLGVQRVSLCLCPCWQVGCRGQDKRNG